MSITTIAVLAAMDSPQRGMMFSARRWLRRSVGGILNTDLPFLRVVVCCARDALHNHLCARTDLNFVLFNDAVSREFRPVSAG